MSNFELLWARFTRAVAFTLGSSIMVFETLAERGERPWLYAAAIGMMGLPVARAAEGILSRWSNTSSPFTPPPEKKAPTEEIPPPEKPVQGKEGTQHETQ